MGKKSIYLSPSTQEKNIGVGNYGSEEKQMNLICDVVEKLLIEHEVIVYRNKPTMSLGEIVRDSNEKNADIHFAIHSNAFNKKSRGCEVFCHRKGGEGEKLSKAVYKKIAAITPTEDRGIKEGYNFYNGKPMYELAYTKMPASLIEIAFHDNPNDARWIINNREMIAVNIAKGILDYFNIEFLSDKIVLFKTTEKAKKILKEISLYHKDWIDFFQQNENINLSGLVENLYDNYKESYKKYEKLTDLLNQVLKTNKEYLSCVTDSIDSILKIIKL